MPGDHIHLRNLRIERSVEELSHLILLLGGFRATCLLATAMCPTGKFYMAVHCSYCLQQWKMSLRHPNTKLDIKRCPTQTRRTTPCNDSAGPPGRSIPSENASCARGIRKPLAFAVESLSLKRWHGVGPRHREQSNQSKRKEGACNSEDQCNMLDRLRQTINHLVLTTTLQTVLPTPTGLELIANKLCHPLINTPVECRNCIIGARCIVRVWGGDLSLALNTIVAFIFCSVPLDSMHMMYTSPYTLIPLHGNHIWKWRSKFQRTWALMQYRSLYMKYIGIYLFINV